MWRLVATSRATVAASAIGARSTHAMRPYFPASDAATSRARRVFPQPPPANADVTAWLRGFIEGLGLTSVVLIAGNGSSAAALELATADDFLVRRLVLMPNAGAPIGDASPERMLWVKPDNSPAHSLQRIEEFIADDRAA